MPDVLKYTPPWLSRPSPGFDIFSSNQASKLQEEASATSEAAVRTIAHRGTEIFVAIDNEVRWSDLIIVRDEWEENRDSQDHKASPQTAHRVLKVPVSRKITQLIISPTGDYLAILTSHTIHVAVLPDPSHLSSEDTGPIRLKTYHVGPTSHVLERSAIASALWHPLGPNGSCLITITVDAIVRLWELDRENKWSFDSPALAVDLRKLANATTAAEDFSPSKYGANKGFSPDSFEMEVVSACFGGAGQEMQCSWATMTLWVAMRNGDIYALCPLLPRKWETTTYSLGNLATQVACGACSTDRSAEISKLAQRISAPQVTWMSDLTAQLTSSDGAIGSLHPTQIFKRPLRPGSVPMLQGPFRVSPNADRIYDITDIYALTTVEDEALDSQDDFGLDATEEALVEFLCIGTSDGQIHVCVDIAGVEGRWLPAKKLPAPEDEDDDFPELLLVESIIVSDSGVDCWPTFSADPQSPDSIFVTHDCGVSHLHLSSWTRKLTAELRGDAESGVHFRMGMLVDSATATVDSPIQLPPSAELDEDVKQNVITSCISIRDSDLGFLVFTIVDGQPQYITLQDDLDFEVEDDSVNASDADTPQGLLTYESRPSYQPPQDLWLESSLTTLINRHVHSHNRRALRDELKLSPSTLKLLMDAHRVLSHETHRLGTAAANLFRRCERLQEEFKEQVRQVHEVADRIDAVLDDDADDYDNQEDAIGTAAKIDLRLETVRERQESLTERYAELRRKLGRLSGRLITEKEGIWAGEIKTMEYMLGMADGANRNDESGEQENGEDSALHVSLSKRSSERLEEVKSLGTQLLAKSEEQGDDGKTDTGSTNGLGMSGDRRRARVEIQALLERQTALVRATRGKLERLSLMST